MSSDATLDDDDDQTDAPESGNSKLRKELKEAKQAVRDAEERARTNESAARRVAFLDAKIPDTPQTRFFLEKYDGELSETAIKAAAQSYGFLAAEDATTQAEIQTIDSMSTTAQGAESPEQAGGMEQMEREMREAAENASTTGQDVGTAVAAVQRRHNRPTTTDTQ